eukprot:COSAG05_NODE_995_length_6259_cov_2.194805_1_plen_527_part_00
MYINSSRNATGDVKQVTSIDHVDHRKGRFVELSLLDSTGRPCKIFVFEWVQGGPNKQWGQLLQSIPTGASREDWAAALSAFRGVDPDIPGSGKPMYVTTTRFIEPWGSGAKLCAAKAEAGEYGPPGPCYNPNENNVNFDVTNEVEDRSIRDARWLKVWAHVSRQAKASGGKAIQVFGEWYGLSGMQDAEADIAYDIGLPLVRQPLARPGVILPEGEGNELPADHTLPPPVALPEPAKTAWSAELDINAATVEFERDSLGSGSFAVVHHGTYQFPGQSKFTPVAFKVFKEQLTGKLVEDTRKEVEMGAQLQHKHLVRLFGVLRLPGNKVALMLELAEGGSLRQVLDDRDRFPELPWPQRLNWLIGIAHGMEHLHDLQPRGIVHRDLKASNVLLTANLSTAKVADFGLATAMETMRSLSASSAGSGSMTGTLAFKAPETFKGQFSEASDMFSMGVTGFEVATRQQPFAGKSEVEIMDKLRERFKINQRLLKKNNISEAEQLEDWLEENPLNDRRPDLTQAEKGCPPCA